MTGAQNAGKKGVDNSGGGGIINFAKAIDSLILEANSKTAKYTREQILEELHKSPVGLETIKRIENSNVIIKIIDAPRADGAKGEQQGIFFQRTFRASA